jgi:pimeloyl-ACP methyl ester carboxylesterase
LLAAHFRVVCPDNAGLGGSRLGEGEMVGGVEGMAADGLALLDALAIESATVVGWSMGGFIAQALTAAAPARVASLSLISTDPGGPDCVLADPEVQALLTDGSGTPREQASRLLALLFPPELATTADANFGDLVGAARAALAEPVLRMQEEAMLAWHARPGTLPARPAAVPMATVPTATAPVPAAAPARPTAIVHGALDRVIPAANATLLSALYPGARVELLPDCAHAPMAQHPEAVAAAIFAVARA